MKTTRMSKQKLKQIKNWCLQRNEEENHLKSSTVEAEYWLHSVINAIQDGITVMDTNYNILLQNEATLQLHNGEKITGKPCYKVHYGRQEPCENCHTVEAMETGQLVKKKQPYQQEGPSGQTFEVYAYPIINENGATTGVVEYLRDITELQKREQALEQSERLKAAVKGYTSKDRIGER